MGDIWTPLQTAIFNLITSDATFINLTNVARDDGNGNTGAQYYIGYVPKWATYPYAVTHGDATSAAWYEFNGGSGEDLIWPIHVWCDLKHGGPQKCRSVASAVMGVMDDASLTVTGFNAMLCRRVYSTLPMRQNSFQYVGDSQLFHQIIRYRIMVQKS